MSTLANNKKAVVTGGSRGIGLAISQQLLAEGYQVIIIARDETIMQQALVELQQAYPDRVNGYCADLSQLAGVTKAVQYISQQFTTVDVVVNNAGSTRQVNVTTPLEQAEQLWQETLAANLTSSFLMTMALVPYLTTGARIVNISSIAAQEGSVYPGAIAYAAAKAGIHGLTVSLARELGARNITVNAIAPGFIDNTNFFGEKGLSREVKQVFANGTALGRNGAVSDIAATACWLVSEAAAFVTGVIVPVNGGWRVG